MMKAKIDIGMQFRLNNRIYKVITVTDSALCIVDLISAEKLELDKCEFNKYWLDNKIKLVEENISDKNRKRLKKTLTNLSTEEKKEIVKKENYIKLFIENKDIEKLKTNKINYDHIILKIAEEIHDPSPPSLRTLLRWKKDYYESNCSIRSLAYSYSNSGKKSTLTKVQKDLTQEAINTKYLTPEKCSVSQTHSELEILVEIYNRQQDEKDKSRIKCPSRFQVDSAIKKIDFYTKVESRDGKREAKRITRIAKHNHRPDEILELGETDHTVLDYFVLDDELLMPLGRPWMTNIVESLSRISLGSDITYENGSFITIGNALKMSILPKDNFYKKYQDINNRANYSGILNCLRTDNGKDFVCNDLQDAAHEIGMILHHVQVTKSWHKGRIEQFFRKQNVKVFDTLQAKAFRNVIERANYNPEKLAFITLSDFKRIIYKWLYDVYPFEKVRIEHGLEVIPHKLWEKNIVNHPQDFIAKNNLDIIFGKGAERNTSSNGIEINRLKYSNNELSHYRKKYGDEKKVKIKYDPNNLGSIYVWNAYENEYYLVDAVDKEYADNLTLFQHNMIKKHVKEEMQQNSDEMKILMDGKIQLREMVHDLIENNPKKLVTKQGNKLRRNISTASIPQISEEVNKKEPKNNQQNLSVKSTKKNKEVDDRDWSDSNIEY